MRKTIDIATVEFSSFPVRIAARVIDMFIVSTLFVAFLSLSGVTMNTDSGVTGDLGIGAAIWFLPLVYLAYEIPGIAVGGQTLGKKMMGIAVVRTDGLIGIGLDRSLTRFIVLMICSCIPFLGLLALGWYLFDPRRQNVPDKAAHTFVIRVSRELIHDRTDMHEPTNEL